MSKFTENDEFYPLPEEIDSWIDSIWDQALSAPCEADITEQNGFTHRMGVHYASPEFRFVKFTPKTGQPFYGYWQPAWSQPAPLLIHVPGYGAEVSSHPDLVMQGYNVLHISPLGYATPDGRRDDLLVDGWWPVLNDTVTSGAERGYKEWLTNCVQAIHWVQTQPGVIPDRISFFGTSQGGGGSLLLGSLFQNRGVRCVAADEPYMINFPLGWGHGAYNLPRAALEALENPADGWRGLGFIDILSHARRLTVPVLVTSGEKDVHIPPFAIETLIEKLPRTRSYTTLYDTPHRYTREFMHLASAWFRLYA